VGFFFTLKKKDNSGYISVQELLQILQSMGQQFDEDQINRLIQSVDADNDGQLSYSEFVKLMKKSLN
jgi:Ca2+-binding EF-hand superfamily protein